VLIYKSCKNSRLSCRVLIPLENRRKKSLTGLISPLVCLITALAIAVVAAGGGYAKITARITKGPFLLRVYENRAALMWETEVEGACKLYYGREQKLDKYIESTGEKVQYKIKENGKDNVKKTAFIHKIWLDDLKPGQVYEYCVIDSEAQSKIYKFRTIPANTDEVRFAVYGDSRTHPETHRKLVKLMIDKKVDFVVHSGDLVTSGERYEQWGPQFFEPLKGLAENVPIYIAKGNHEGDSGNYEKQLIPVGEKNSFGFDYGPVHYFCADNISKGLKAEEVLKLIATDAGSSKAQWKFVSYHIPSLNFGGHWSAWGYPNALPTLAKAGVDFVIVGHSHQYERFRPVAPPGETDGSYVTYITSGGGGAPLHDINVSDYHVYAQKINHVCIFDIKGNKLSMKTIGIDGQVIDHLQITKTNGNLNKEYIEKAVPMEQISAYQAANRHKEH